MTCPMDRQIQERNKNETTKQNRIHYWNKIDLQSIYKIMHFLIQIYHSNLTPLLINTYAQLKRKCVFLQKRKKQIIKTSWNSKLKYNFFFKCLLIQIMFKSYIKETLLVKKKCLVVYKSCKMSPFKHDPEKGHRGQDLSGSNLLMCPPPTGPGRI